MLHIRAAVAASKHTRWLLVAWSLGYPFVGRAAAAPVYVALGVHVPGAATGHAPPQIVERLARAGWHVALVNLTSPDASIASIREARLSDALKARPALVTLVLGEKEICGASPLRTFARDLTVVSDFLSRSGAHVVISALPRPEGHCGRTRRALQQRLAAFNWTIVYTAERYGFRLAQAAPGHDTAEEIDRALERELARSASEHGPLGRL